MKVVRSSIHKALFRVKILADVNKASFAVNWDSVMYNTECSGLHKSISTSLRTLPCTQH